MIRHDATPMST
jgi:hypothetical protein